MAEPIKFLVRIPMRQSDIVRIHAYLREGYRLLHDDEQEQEQEQAEAKGTSA